MASPAPPKATRHRHKFIRTALAVLAAAVALTAILVGVEIAALRATGGPQSIASASLTSTSATTGSNNLTLVATGVALRFAPPLGSTLSVCDCSVTLEAAQPPLRLTAPLALDGTAGCALLTRANPILSFSANVAALPLLQWFAPPGGSIVAGHSLELSCARVTAALFGGPVTFTTSLSLSADVDTSAVAALATDALSTVLEAVTPSQATSTPSAAADTSPAPSPSPAPFAGFDTVSRVSLPLSAPGAFPLALPGGITLAALTLDLPGGEVLLSGRRAGNRNGDDGFAALAAVTVSRLTGAWPGLRPAVLTATVGVASARLTSAFASPALAASLAAHVLLEQLPPALRTALLESPALAPLLDAARPDDPDVAFDLMLLGGAPGLGGRGLGLSGLLAAPTTTLVALDGMAVEAAGAAATEHGLPSDESLLGAVAGWLLGGPHADESSPQVVCGSGGGGGAPPAPLRLAWVGQFVLHTTGADAPSSTAGGAGQGQGRRLQASPTPTSTPRASATPLPEAFQFTIWSPIFRVDALTLSASVAVTLTNAPSASFLAAYLATHMQSLIGRSFSYSAALTTVIDTAWRDCANTGAPAVNYNIWSVDARRTLPARRVTPCGSIVGGVTLLPNSSDVAAPILPGFTLSGSLHLGRMTACLAHLADEYGLPGAAPRPPSCLISEPAAPLTPGLVYPGGHLLAQVQGVVSLSIPLSLSRGVRTWLRAPASLTSFSPVPFVLDPQRNPSLTPPWAIDPDSPASAPPLWSVLPADVLLIGSYTGYNTIGISGLAISSSIVYETAYFLQGLDGSGFAPCSGYSPGSFTTPCRGGIAAALQSSGFLGVYGLLLGGGTQQLPGGATAPLCKVRLLGASGDTLLEFDLLAQPPLFAQAGGVMASMRDSAITVGAASIPGAVTASALALSGTLPLPGLAGVTAVSSFE